MSPCARYLLPLALLLLTAAAGAQEWVVYHSAEADTEELSRHTAPLLPEGVRLRLCALPPTCETTQEARTHACAIADGISALPALALRDAHGAYAVLPLQGLSAEKLQQAAALSTAENRKAAAQRRLTAARIYLLRFALSRAASTADQDTIIARMQELMQAADTPEDMRQLIALHCVYPALLQQYTAEYRERGAHTPRTEAKLLEAIRALEFARDSDRSSAAGRRAHTERERLRAARLKSRQYE